MNDLAVRVTAVMFADVIVSGVILLLIPSETVPLAAPLLADFSLALFFITVLLLRDRRVPVRARSERFLAANPPWSYRRRTAARAPVIR